MDVIATAQELIRIESPSPLPNAEISDASESLLAGLGFEVERLLYTDLAGNSKTAIAAKRPALRGRETPLSSSLLDQPGRPVGFFAHNDVVPVDGWNCQYGGPWDANIAQGRLWGRGACDMKGPMAAALAAIAQTDVASQLADLYYFITGDEESGMVGARELAGNSDFYTQFRDSRGVGVICEPTLLSVVNAHKGGCHVNVTSRGVAAHSSTSEGKNANWQLIPFLEYARDVAERCRRDAQLLSDCFDPPDLSLNIVIENRPAAGNITVGEAICRLFLRPMPETAWETLVAEIVATAESMGLQTGPIRPLLPLSTSANRDYVVRLLKLTGTEQPVAVSYATDGCCFGDLPDLVVLGPGSIEQAHRPDEWISLDQLHEGTRVYTDVVRHFCCNQ